MLVVVELVLVEEVGVVACLAVTSWVGVSVPIRRRICDS